MKCPRCRSRELQVEVAFVGEVSCSFKDSVEFDIIEPVALDSEWSDDSKCRCVACGWVGLVTEAQSSPKLCKPVKTESFLSDPDKVETIARRLDRLPPSWGQAVQHLLDEVHRLDQMLQMAVRANGSGTRSTGETEVM